MMISQTHPDQSVQPHRRIPEESCVLDKVSKEFNIPPIPDYYFLLANFLGKDYVTATKAVIQHMINRDYPSMKSLFSGFLQ